MCRGFSKPSQAPRDPSPAPRKWQGQPSPVLSSPGEEGPPRCADAVHTPFWQQLPRSKGAGLELQLSWLTCVLGDRLPRFPGWECWVSLAVVTIFTAPSLAPWEPSSLIFSVAHLGALHRKLSLLLVTQVRFAECKLGEGSSPFPHWLPLVLKFSPQLLDSRLYSDCMDLAWNSLSHQRIPRTPQLNSIHPQCV